MLLVRVRADRSAIHGLAVFAVESICRSSPVWRFSPDRYGVDVAVRDIAAGDELTVDYETIEARGGSF